jgi:hypothetical protein
MIELLQDFIKNKRNQIRYIQKIANISNLKINIDLFDNDRYKYLVLLENFLLNNFTDKIEIKNDRIYLYKEAKYNISICISKSDDNILDCHICIIIKDYHKNCLSKYSCETLETIDIFNLNDELLIDKIHKYINIDNIICDCNNKI